MELKQRGILLYAESFNSKGQDGQPIQGVSLRYIMSDNLTPRSDTDSSRGIKPLKSWMPLNIMKSIVEAPGIYEFSYGMTVKGDKPALDIIGLKYISPIPQAAQK